MTNQEIIATGQTIANETHIGGNTAERVGGVIKGIGVALDNKDAANGYYQATISGGTITVNAPNYLLGTGGNLRIKMPAAATTASTLTIGNANAVQLWYNGAAVSNENTWGVGEIISVFYDGTRFMASNSQGGGETGTTFTPYVDSDGNLSWTNDGGKPNPETVNIKGKKGDTVILGEGKTYTLYNSTGQNTDGAMTQKAVTDLFEGIEQNLVDRPYVETTPSIQGNMGYKILRKGITFASQVTEANTIYEIQYDYDLDGQTITLPNRCALKFNGGSLFNGTITGNNTLIQGRTDLSNVTLSGSFANEYFDLYDVGCIPNDSSVASDNTTRMLSLIRSLENIKLTLVVPDGDWYFDTPLVLSGDFSLQCDGMLVYKSDANNVISSALTIGSLAKTFQHKHSIKLTQDSTYEFTTTIIENVGLRLINASNSNVSILEVSNFVYGIIIEANREGCAYNTFNLGRLGWGNCYCPIKLQPIDTNGWVNENLFIGGAIHNQSINVYKNNNVGLWIEGSAAHKANNNVFLKPCLEGATVGVKFVNATQNCIYDMRDEAVSTIQQSTDSRTNFISRFSGAVNFQTLVSDKFTKFNIARQHVFSARTSFTRYQIGSNRYASSIQLDVATYGPNTAIGQNIRLYGTITYTGKIVDTSSVKCFSVGLKNKGRCVIVCYDANDNVISPSNRSDIIAANNISFSISGDGHTLIAQSDNTYFDFEFTSAVKKAFIGCDATKSKFIEVYAYTENKYGEFGISTGLNTCNDLNTAETINAEVGDVLLDSNGVPAMWNGGKWAMLDGYSVDVPHKGTTAQRPTGILTDSDIGFEYFDLDLQKEIYFSIKERRVLQFSIPRNDGSTSERGTVLMPNTLEGNKSHRFTYSSVQTWGGKLVFRKTDSTETTEDDDIIIFPYFHATVQEKEMVTPDPQEYPYIFGSNAWASEEIITAYTDMPVWIEYDDVIAGVLRHGATADRPDSEDIYVGFEYFDETLGKPVYYNGTRWVDAAGSVV